MADSRPKNYQYLEMLKNHLGGWDRVFNGKAILPRQLEIHLPANGKRFCNFNCYYCQGALLKRPLGVWEKKGLRLLKRLKGKIPYHIYGGAYTEPLMNKHLLSYLEMTKEFDNDFGIHTNGSLLMKLQKDIGFLERLCELGQTEQDYLSISLDAGFPESHCETKGLKKNFFDEIVKGIAEAVKIRGDRTVPKIRVCFLMNRVNSSVEEIENIIRICKEIKTDSLRFSIPYDIYGKDFEIVRGYKQLTEKEWGSKVEEFMQKYLSKSQEERPYIFFLNPHFQDVDRMCFKQCIYSYYQITLAADGNVYRCSSTASPTFPANMLGKITDSLDEFMAMVKRSHDSGWKPETCFGVGGRCNRMALEINTGYNELKKGGELR